jgi:hypothetical protein
MGMWTAWWHAPQDHRRQAYSACALLVLAASIHCAWEWQDVLRQIATAGHLRVERQPIPLGWPRHGCPNEYGCICRGATLVQSVSVSGLDEHPGGLQTPVPDGIGLAAHQDRPEILNSASSSFCENACPSYLSGGCRRALLGCFLI